MIWLTSSCSHLSEVIASTTVPSSLERRGTPRQQCAPWFIILTGFSSDSSPILIGWTVPSPCTPDSCKITFCKLLLVLHLSRASYCCRRVIQLMGQMAGIGLTSIGTSCPTESREGMRCGCSPCPLPAALTTLWASLGHPNSPTCNTEVVYVTCPLVSYPTCIRFFSLTY